MTSTTLTASTTAQGTMLTANVVVTSPGNPPIVGTVSFYDGGTLLGTVPVSNGVATLNVGTLSPGSHSFSAVFSGGGTFSASESSLVVSTDGPRVTSVLRYGFHWQPTYLLVNFNGPLDPTSAQNPSNYQILGPSGHRITVVSAIYDSATHTVTLVPAERLNIHRRYRLTVNGTAPFGLTNPSGELLDGAGNGHPGSNYVTSVTWRNLAGRASKLPTLGLVHAARPRPARTQTSPQQRPGDITYGGRRPSAGDRIVEGPWAPREALSQFSPLSTERGTRLIAGISSDTTFLYCPVNLVSINFSDFCPILAFLSRNGIWFVYVCVQ